jgi:hypothetical protein
MVVILLIAVPYGVEGMAAESAPSAPEIAPTLVVVR